MLTARTLEPPDHRRTASRSARSATTRRRLAATCASSSTLIGSRASACSAEPRRCGRRASFVDALNIDTGQLFAASIVGELPALHRQHKVFRYLQRVEDVMHRGAHVRRAAATMLHLLKLTGFMSTSDWNGWIRPRRPARDARGGTPSKRTCGDDGLITAHNKVVPPGACCGMDPSHSPVPPCAPGIGAVKPRTLKRRPALRFFDPRGGNRMAHHVVHRSCWRHRRAPPPGASASGGRVAITQWEWSFFSAIAQMLEQRHRLHHCANRPRAVGLHVLHPSGGVLYAIFVKATADDLVVSVDVTVAGRGDGHVLDHPVHAEPALAAHARRRGLAVVSGHIGRERSAA